MEEITPHEEQRIQSPADTTRLAQTHLQDEAEFTPSSVLSQLQPIPNNPSLKPDALEHDIKLGWVPRSQISGPIPLSFAHESLDWVIENKQQSLIYVGFRPQNTFDLHQRFYGEGKNYPFYQLHLSKAKFLDRFFKKYYSDYIFEGREARVVQQSQLQFDSYFEGGNLDAVYLQEDEYCLLIRVDSNTVGHCNYYNFKVKPCSRGTYKFRIMNISKWKSLYQRGMRPYVRKIKNGIPTSFEQAGDKVRFGDSPLLQQFDFKTLKSLRFQYHFDEPYVEYQFCYTIPYTYSELYASIRSHKNNYLHLSKLCHSLSGLEIPLLTVTAPDRETTSNETYAIAVIGRVHPSEATGSHIVNGFLKELINQSPEAKWIRNKVVFKIVPMLNPDGVILGNTRTGVAGKDLNRLYRKNRQFVFPEVNGIIDYVTKLKEKYGKKLLFLIDIHGHSTRKNSFFFGPEYPIMDQEYTRCRLLPKIFSSRTEIFRYYSCKFKVSSFKEATARGYFNNNGIRTYTHQTSAHCFFDFSTRKDKPFTRNTLQELGKALLLSIHDYVKMISGKDVAPPPEPQLPQAFRPRSSLDGPAVAEELSSDSDKISSNRDDSQDDAEDFQERKLFQFFSKINENREYFYEQLVALNGLQAQPKIGKKEQRKPRRSQSLKSEESKISEIKINNFPSHLQEELVVGRRQSEKKIDWVSMVSYPQKKKLLQQYPKLSSVIFGSSIPSHFFNSEQPSQSSFVSASEQEGSINFGFSTKYSINYINAQFQSTQAKYPSPEPKIQKTLKPLKKEASLNELPQQHKDPMEAKLGIDKKTRERYLQLKEQILQSRAPPPAYASSAVRETFYRRSGDYQCIRALPVCPVEMGSLGEKKREEAEIMRMTTSLKVLTRKKSIKNIRESQSVQVRKISKSIKAGSLTKKLPFLNPLLLKR